MKNGTSIFRISLYCFLATSAMAADCRWEFDDDESVDAWRKDCVSTTVEWGETGTLQLKATRGTPYIFSPKTEIEADKQNVVVFRMKLAPGVVSGGFVVFITKDDPTWDDRKMVNFQCYPGGGFCEYEVDMSKNPLWKGTVIQIRLLAMYIADTALTEENSVIEIDYIRVPDLSSFAGGQLVEEEYRQAQTPYVKLTGEVVTPHIAWATPYAGGAVKVLAIPPHREVIELGQRLEIEYETWEKLTHMETYESNEVLDRLYYKPSRRGLLYSMADFNRKLSRPCDVILIGTYDLSSLPELLRNKLIEKVKQGTGLVVIRPKNIAWLTPAMATPAPIPDDIFVGVPVNALPVLGQDAKRAQWLKNYVYGKGRVVIVDYPNERLKWFRVEGDLLRGRQFPFTPDMTYDAGLKSLFYDYYQSWLAKLVLWAARKEVGISIDKLMVQDGKLDVKLNSETSIEKAMVEIIFRDPDNVVEATDLRKLALAKGETNFTQTIPVLKSGPHFADVWIKNEKGRVLNWGSAWFQTSSAFNIVTVKTGRFSYQPGDTVTGTVGLDQPYTKNAAIRLDLRDSLGRILEKKALAGVEGREIPFEFQLRGPVAIVHEVVANLLDDQRRIISQAKSEFVVKKPYDPLDDFHFWSWGRDGHDRFKVHLLQDIYRRGFDAAFIINTMFALPEDEYRDLLMTCARQNLYPAQIANSELHAGAETSDVNQTIRNRAIAGKPFRDALFSDLRKKGLVGKDFPVPAYCLGDEISLSNFGQDFDFSPSGLEFIRNDLKSMYKELARLNEKWGTNFSGWEQVMPMTITQAQQHGKFAPWVDLRTAMENMWTDTIRFAADTIRQVDPDARVGAQTMGCELAAVNGEDSHNGYDFGKVIPQGRSWGCYFQLYPDIEFLRSFAVSGTVLYTPTNPFEDWPGGYFSDYRIAEQTDRFVAWYDVFHGFNTVLFWDSRDVDWFGFYTKDFRPTPWAENITQTIQEIKRGIGKLVLKCKRENNGIAIHYSPPSLHAETILGGKERRECPRAFCLLLEDLGLQYDFISAEQMSAGKLANYRFLILPYSRAITEGEAKAMQKFAASGGTLFADGPVGIMDGNCTYVKENMLAGVKVATASKPVWDYVKIRDGEDGAKRRQEIREALAKGGIEPRYRIMSRDKSEITGCEVVEFKDGAATYLGILQGREYIKTEDSSRPVHIALPAKCHVYSVREGKYLGYLDAIDTTVKPAVAKLYALLPCKIKCLTVEKMMKEYAPGMEVKYSVRAETAPAVTIPLVVHVEIVAPGERPYKEYGRNLSLPEGTVEASFTLALNDPSGSWKIAVTDVATGMKTKRAFTVKK